MPIVHSAVYSGACDLYRPTPQRMFLIQNGFLAFVVYPPNKLGHKPRTTSTNRSAHTPNGMAARLRIIHSMTLATTQLDFFTGPAGAHHPNEVVMRFFQLA